MAKKKPIKNRAPAIITSRIGVEEIERIWAHLGQIWVETKTGVVKTWTPVEAAKLATLCGVLANTEGFSNLECKQWLELKNLTCEAIREACSQGENPGDSTTKAVVGAIKASDMMMIDDDQMKTRLVRFGSMFPVLKEDEIRALIQQFPGKTDSWYEGALKELEESRLRYLEQRRRGEKGELHPTAEKQTF